MTEESSTSPSRRRFFKGLSLIPVTVVSLPACTKTTPEPGAAALESRDTARHVGGASADAPYKPAFFSQAEWEFLRAACDVLIPTDDLGPGAVDVGALEFIDRHMQTPYAAGDIWFMQGPYLDADPLFGYQGKLPVRDIMRIGIQDFDKHCKRNFDNKTFAQLSREQQTGLIKEAEGGKLEFESISSKLFFVHLLNETRYGYFADPLHGGNKDMQGWKTVGYPGMRADYLDWVEVRDKPYPLPPVDLSGRRA